MKYLNEHEKFLFEEDGMNVGGEANMDAGGGEPVDTVMPESPDSLMEAMDDPFHNFAHIDDPIDLNRAKAIMGMNGYLIKIGSTFFVSGHNPYHDPLYPIDQKVASQFGNNIEVVKDNPDSSYKPWKVMRVKSGAETPDIHKGMKTVRPPIGKEYRTFESKEKKLKEARVDVDEVLKKYNGNRPWTRDDHDDLMYLARTLDKDDPKLSQVRKALGLEEKLKEAYADMNDEDLQKEYDKHEGDKEGYDGNKTNPKYPKFKQAVNTQKQIKNVQRNRDKVAGKAPLKDPTCSPVKDRAARNMPWEKKESTKHFNVDLFVEKAIKRGLNKEQIKLLLKESYLEDTSKYLEPLMDHLEDSNDHSAYAVLEAMLKYPNVEKFKIAADRWIKRESQGYL